LHLTLFEFLRNNDLNARNFFDPAVKPVLRRNQFGGTVGGPVELPKLYDGRNKTFWLFNYEGVRQSSPSTRVSAVPTQAQLGGDLSTVAAATVKDPSTGQPFPNKQVPASRFDSASQVYRQFMPVATALPGAFGPGINLVTPISAVGNFDQFTVRFDHQFSSNSHGFARYTFNDSTNITPGLVPQYTTSGLARDQNAVLGHNMVIHPTLINEFRASFSRHTLHQGPGFHSSTNFAESMGLQNTLSREPSFNSLPIANLTGYTAMGGPALITQRGNTFQFVDNLTWILGSHTFKFGGDIRREMLDIRNIGSTNGTFAFSGVFSGNSIADFLLGIPQSASAAAPPGPDGVNLSTVWQGFAQDDWKVSSDLTISLGVRYEYQAPFTNNRGERSIFDPTFPGGRLLYGGLPEYFVPGQGFTKTDRPLAPPGLVPPDRNNFAPRFGFAWRPFGNNRNVVRGSYGVFFEAQNANNEILFGSFNYPDQLSYQLTNDVINPSFRWSSLFPTQVTAGAIGFNSLDQRMPIGYIQQWSFNLQRELRPNLAFEAGYMGSKGTKLDWRNSANQAVLDADPAHPTPLASRQPIPAFAANALIITRDGFSTYHAFLARLERNFSNGLQFLVSYTFSKSIDNSSFAGNIGAQPAQPANTYNRSNEKGLSYFDVPQRLAVSYVWDLPFGRGRRYLNQHGFVDAVLGGWQLAGITQMQTGNPWTILIAGDTANVGTGSQRADQVGVVYPIGFVSGGPSRLAFNPSQRYLKY
jgi:TonB dependent receptor